jgi:hypothetical protein
MRNSKFPKLTSIKGEVMTSLAYAADATSLQQIH